ncbi:hypothetical protein HNV11_07905 [Spirosoma taeanense]|uniref:Uncharacterized protein n=1 Tax=Spirosoma taeanense TaxID=2735870 RepID=A0A6M5Y821_9BACT|nr:hypothetical protein [Spirosoma taeanense]QJW89313.1 hypothetical protein HNV11_07905 [Spirosoma taeanense]
MKALLVAALLTGQLALNACQPQNEAVLPSETVTSLNKATVSDWTAVDADIWAASAKTPKARVAGFIDNAITSAVVEEGLVVAFHRDPATGNVRTLPATIGDQSLSFTYYATNNKGIVSLQQEAPEPVAGEYRWVVVPKEVAATVNWNDYSAVKQALKLEE